MLPLAADNLLILNIIICFSSDANTKRDDFNDQDLRLNARKLCMLHV